MKSDLTQEPRAKGRREETPKPSIESMFRCRTHDKSVSIRVSCTTISISRLTHPVHDFGRQATPACSLPGLTAQNHELRNQDERTPRFCSKSKEDTYLFRLCSYRTPSREYPFKSSRGAESLCASRASRTVNFTGKVNVGDFDNTHMSDI